MNINNNINRNTYTNFGNFLKMKILNQDKIVKVKIIVFNHRNIIIIIPRSIQKKMNILKNMAKLIIKAILIQI